jgi:hypothetical protein
MTPDPTLVFHLRTVGVLMAVLAIVNLFVPGRFHWREELSRVSLVNRQIFQAHTMFIVLLIVLTSALLLTSAEALLEPSRLSRAVMIGLTIFWGLRMLVQWFFYSPQIWRGSRFHTAMHAIFSLGWIYVTAVCGLTLRAIS